MPIPLKFKAALDDSAFMAGIRRIKTASSKLGGRAGAAAGALGRGGAGLVGGIGAAAGVRSIANQADQLYNLSRKTGMTTTSLAALAEMGKGANIEMEQLAKSVVRMQQSMETKAGQDAIESLGLNLEELKAMRPEEQFRQIGAAIGSIADQNKKIDATKGIFQRGGSDLFELFDDIGKLDMGKVSQNAKQMGEAAKPIADAMDKLGSFGVGVAARGATMMKQLLEGDIKGFFSRSRATPTFSPDSYIHKPAMKEGSPLETFFTANKGGTMLGQRGGLGSGGIGGGAYGYVKRGDAKIAKQAEANIKALKLQEDAVAELKAMRETLDSWDQ